MTIQEAQKEVRQVYIGGSIGQLVSGVIWLLAAVLASWSSEGRAILVLVVGGMFIYPLTQVILKLLGRPASLAPQNPFRFLAMQIAFTVPLTLPLAGAAALYKLEWFFPACLLVVGAHYLPFVSLYGMRSYAILGAAMCAAGLGIGLYFQQSFALGAWAGALFLIMFGLVTAISYRGD